jgi:hypothetical protein
VSRLNLKGNNAKEERHRQLQKDSNEQKSNGSTDSNLLLHLVNGNRVRPSSAASHRMGAPAPDSFSRLGDSAKLHRPRSAVPLIRDLPKLVRSDREREAESLWSQSFEGFRDHLGDLGISSFSSAQPLPESKPGVTIFQNDDKKLRVEIRVRPEPSRVRPSAVCSRKDEKDDLSDDGGDSEAQSPLLCAWAGDHE